MAGPFERLSPRSFFEGREVIIAASLSLVWILVLAGYSAGYFGLLGDLAEPRDAAFLEIMFFLLVLVLPISLVWLGSALMRRSFQIQDEARRLERQVRELQAGGGNPKQSGVSQPRIKDNRVENLQQRVSDLSSQIKNMEAALVAMKKTHVTPSASQPDFTFEEPKGTPPENDLSWKDFIRALDFPQDEKDSEGFRALRLAKKDADAGQLLRATEDILNLLSQEGIYMDDFEPQPATPADWRKFASGTRGASITSVGAIEAPEAVERIDARGKKDQIFHDTSLYFLRRFDIMLRALASGASDAEIQVLANTRTGRAFMLLGRVAGMFG